MTESSKTESKASLSKVHFIDFWKRIASDLGTSRLRINDDAKSINDFFHKNSDVRPYLIDAIKRSYKQNKCQHLGSPISIAVVLDILGETAYALYGSKTDDLLDIELLEEIALYINNHYLTYLDADISSNLNPSSNKISPSTVIPFPKYKTWKINRLL